jgi:hypothetical protein
MENRAMTEERMTKADSRELRTLARKRAKLLKAATAERRAEVMADFEAQLASVYTGDDDAEMRRLRMVADAAVAEVERQLAEHCQERGIPPRFAPGLSLVWHGRGENALASRRNELRTVVISRLNALEKQAHTAIERACVEIETELIGATLTTDDAREYLASMPDPADLMPSFDVSEIASLLPARTRQKFDDVVALRDESRRLLGGGEAG